MDQERIGKFIAENRKKQKLTQAELAEKLGVSTNAVSKWERGICLMDMSLIKPLSTILEINIIDLLSGENVEIENRENKYEESIENIIKLNEIKSKSFGVYGMLLIYTALIIFKIMKGIPFFDLVATLCFFNAFKFFYKYKLEKEKGNLMISIISLLTCILLLVEYIKIV